MLPASRFGGGGVFLAVVGEGALVAPVAGTLTLGVLARNKTFVSRLRALGERVGNLPTEGKVAVPTEA